MPIDVNGIIYAERDQVDLSAGSEGVDAKLKASLLGQLYVADWKYLLGAAGRMFRVSMGTVTAGGDITGLSGHATLDSDQPELAVVADSGLALIPVELEVGVQDDNDAYEDEVEVLMTVDRSTAITTSEMAGGTQAESNLANGISIQNELDGGSSFGGRVSAAFSSDVTDPVHSAVLAYRLWEAKQLAAETAGTPPQDMHYSKQWSYPSINKGDCSILLYVAGTVAPTFHGSFVFGAVPSSWFPTS